MIYSQILFISSFSSLKDIKIVIFFLCPRAPGDSFEIGVAGCDLAAPIDREFRLRNLFTRNFHVAERKYSVYVTAFVRGPVRCFLVRVDANRYFTLSRAAVSVYEAECRDRKQFVRLGQVSKFYKSFTSRIRKTASRITDCGARFGVRRCKESDINLQKEWISQLLFERVVYIRSIVIYVWLSKKSAGFRALVFHS